MNNFTESLPKSGHVNEVCKEWLVREDGALAYKLQSQEINDFYKGNRFRNAVVREDFPTALHEQIKEAENAEKQAEVYRRRLQEQEEHDKRVANEIAQKLERDLLEQQQKELQESELIAQQMQEIYVNLPPVPPPASREKTRPPPRPAKASTLQQQQAQAAGESNGRPPINHASSNQQLLHQQHQQFSNTDNYVGLTLAQHIVNQPHQTPTRQRASGSPHALPALSCNGFGASQQFVVSDAGSPTASSTSRHAAAAAAAANTPIILSNEHFINQQQTQPQPQPQYRHQHSSSNVSTNSSTKSSASSSARRNVFDYHNLPNQPFSTTALHSPLPHTPNTPQTPSTLVNSMHNSSTHSDIEELIEYSDVADSIRRYDINAAQSPLGKDAHDSLHNSFTRMKSPSNENLLRNEHKFQKLSPEKYDQLVGNEGQACSAAAAATERELQQHADDIELYVDPCDYASLQEIGLPMEEIKELSKKLKQEQKDELLARRLQEMEATDGLTQEQRDRLLAIEAQDKELAKMLQEREKAKIKRAKEKARQRKHQQKEAAGGTALCSPSSTNGGGLHCGPLLTLPQDCLNACNPHAKHYTDSSPQHQATYQHEPSTPTTLLDDELLDMEAYSNPIDVIQQQSQRPTNGLLTNGSLTRDKPNIGRLQTSRSHNDDDIYTLPVDSCRNGTQHRPTSLQVSSDNAALDMPAQHSSMTRSENYALDAHDTLNGHDVTPRMAYTSKPSTFDQSASPTPPYMPIQGSRRLHAGDDRKKKSKDSKCTHQ